MATCGIRGLTSNNRNDSIKWFCFTCTVHGELLLSVIYFPFSSCNFFRIKYQNYLSLCICLQHHKATNVGPAQKLLQKQKSFIQREKMVTNRILLMTLSFLISWAPFTWVYLLPLFRTQDGDPSKASDVLPLITAKLGSSIINPLVYVFGNSEVSTEYTSLY